MLHSANVMILHRWAVEYLQGWSSITNKLSVYHRMFLVKHVWDNILLPRGVKALQISLLINTSPLHSPITVWLIKHQQPQYNVSDIYLDDFWPNLTKYYIRLVITDSIQVNCMKPLSCNHQQPMKAICDLLSVVNNRRHLKWEATKEITVWEFQAISPLPSPPPSFCPHSFFF